jgi:ribosome-binding factor A
MTAYSRADRVGGLIQRTLSDLLLRSVKDPRIQQATITHVKVTRDLRIARIYFSVSGGPRSVEAAAAGFASALGYVRRTLADRLGLRYMPEIEFFYDESFDYGSHIEQLLQSIDKKQ